MLGSEEDEIQSSGRSLMAMMSQSSGSMFARYLDNLIVLFLDKEQHDVLSKFRLVHVTDFLFLFQGTCAFPDCADHKAVKLCLFLLFLLTHKRLSETLVKSIWLKTRVKSIQVFKYSI